MGRLGRTLMATVMALALATLASFGFATSPVVAASSTTSMTIPGAGVQLDTTVYVPARTPAPAILLAHGWGGSKNSVAGQAASLQSAGYLVLAWSARGFGNSTGYITVDSPGAEVADVSRLIDYLAGRGDVQMDAPGNPRVGISGGSYGGAVSLMAGALDQRIDAIAADITWNNYQQAFFPQFAHGVSRSGVLKRSWAQAFFASAVAAVPGSQCGRIDPVWCAEYLSMISTGVPSANLSQLMRGSSPSTYNDLVTAPVLLTQGQADSLFGLEESARTAQEICAAHPEGKVAVVWHLAGHSVTATAATSADSVRVSGLIKQWFDINLRSASGQFASFQVTRPSSTSVMPDGSAAPVVYTSDTLPLALQQTPMAIPVNTSTIASSGTNSAQWATAPVTEPVAVVGSPTARMRIASSNGEATLFFSTLVKRANGSTVKPQSLTSPIRLSSIPASGIDVLVNLPTVALNLARGDALALSATISESGYDAASGSRSYAVTPLGPLQVPLIGVQPQPSVAVNLPGPISKRWRPPVGCAAVTSN